MGWRGMARARGAGVGVGVKPEEEGRGRVTRLRPLRPRFSRRAVGMCCRAVMKRRSQLVSHGRGVVVGTVADPALRA